MAEATVSAVGPEFETSYRDGRLLAVLNNNFTEYDDPKSLLTRGFGAQGDKSDAGSSLPAFAVLAAMAATAIFILVLAVIIGKLRGKNEPSDEDAEKDAQQQTDAKDFSASNMEKKLAAEQDEKLPSNFPAVAMPGMMEKMKKRLFPHRPAQQNQSVSTINIPKEHLQEIVVF